MLRDSVCDEATNTEMCLYDGGDCCLELKDRTLCSNCSCILTIKPEELRQQFLDLEIKPLSDPAKYPSVNKIAGVKVEDVVSGPVCATLCLDPERGDDINAWRYRASKQICQCSWIKSTACPKTIVDLDWTLTSVTTLTSDQDNAFVQLGKTIPCSKEKKVIYLLYIL